MIELTRHTARSDAEPILVNPRHIAIIESGDGVTVIRMADGVIRRVVEGPEQVRMRIREQQTYIPQ